MKKNTSLNICQNHLPALYAALTSKDLKAVTKLEHQLTPSEKCVACTYLLKVQGPTKLVFEKLLVQEGVCHFTKSQSTSILSHLQYWSLRLGILAVIFMTTFSFFSFLKSKLFNLSYRPELGFNLFESVTLIILSIFIFLYIDDTLLE